MIRVKSEQKKRRVVGPIDPEKLKRYVARIEAVEEEEATQKDAKKDIYVEVKASGMKPKMVRKIIKERKAKAADAAEEAELDTYRDALTMPGATYRSVAEKIGIPRSTLHRLVPRAKNGTEPPHDPKTDDVPPVATQTEREDLGSPAVAAPLVSEQADPPATEIARPDGQAGDGGETAATRCRPSPTVPACAHCDGSGILFHPGDGALVDWEEPCPFCREEQPPPTESLGAVAKPEAERVATQNPDDDLAFPPHLIRVRQLPTSTTPVTGNQQEK